MAKSILFISGRISKWEVNTLRREFQNDEYEIVKYVGNGATISGIHDIVSLFFHDFSIYSFARDLILAKVVDGTWKALISIIDRLKIKQKVVNNLEILVEYQKQDGTMLLITFDSQVEKFDILIQEVYKNLAPDYFEGIKGGVDVNITLDGEDRLVITVVP